MTLRHLRIFTAVCETGSVTAAGKKLYIAQPSVSLAIAELETYYGVKLFDRIAKKLYLTETGKQFLQYASHIVSLFDEMERGIKNWETAGTLRIGSSITIGSRLLPSYVHQLTQAFPDLHPKITIDNSETIEKMVLENLLDIALIEGKIHSSQLIGEVFARDTLVFLCPPGHAFAGKTVALEHLARETLILRETGSAGREIFDAITQMGGLNISPAWQSISTEAILRAVSEGLGITILPYLLAQENLKEKHISQFWVKNISTKRDLSIIYHKNKYITAGAQYFLEICRNTAI